MKKILTKFQVYCAMIRFLEIYYEKTKSDDLAVLLGGMSLLPNGETADPAAWTDWINSVNAIQNSDEKTLTILQSFWATIKFLEIYYSHTHSADTLVLLNETQNLANTSILNTIIYKNWHKCIETVLNESNKDHYNLMLTKNK